MRKSVRIGPKLTVEANRLGQQWAEDAAAALQAETDKEILNATCSSDPATNVITTKEIREAAEIFEKEAAKFLPEIWSKKIVEKLFSESLDKVIVRDYSIASPEDIMVWAAEKVEKLKAEGRTESEIERELGAYLEGLAKQKEANDRVLINPLKNGKIGKIDNFTFHPWKTWNI